MTTPTNDPASGMPVVSAQQAQRSPFAAITVRDYIVDAGALILLIVSLFLPWLPSYTGAPVAATRVDVLLITILSIISLGMTYIWRAGSFGPSWNYTKMQDARLLANIPYFGMVLVYLVVMGASSTAWFLGGLAVVLAFLLPAAFLVLLWGPASMRSHYGSLPAGAGGQSGFSFDGVGTPAPPVMTAPVPTFVAAPVPETVETVDVVDPMIVEAANPATTPARLHELAATSPHVHAVIAANPADYPQLLEWLVSVNGPGVAEALANRR